MKNIYARLLAAFAVVLMAIPAQAQFTSGQVLTATALNNAIAQPHITGGTITGLSAPIPVTSGGTGATTATGAVANLLAPTTVPIIGCDTTGATDATTCVQTRINALTGGGRIKITGKLLISSNLTVPAGVTLEGDCVMPGTIGSNSSAPYGNLTCGVLMVASTATITVSAAGGLESLLIYRSGMTFPATDSSLFAGTAITLGGDDVGIDHVMVLGFNKAIYGTGAQRPKINALYGDNSNGIELTQVFDIPRITNCHMWPFATIAATGTAARNQRTGTAYYLHDTVDAPMLANNFAYGYNIGFQFANVSTVNAVNNMADNTGSYAGSIGWSFSGNLNGYTGSGNSTWSQATGAYVNLNAGQIVDLSKMAFNTNTTQINVASGNVKAYHSEFFSSTTLLSVALATSIIDIDHNTLSGNTNNVIASVATTNVYVGPDNVNLTAANGTSMTSINVTSRQLASADPLALPPYGNTFVITGTTGFGNLSGGWAGREVTLIFQGALTIFSSIANANSMYLLGGNNYAAAANSAITFIHTGTQWIQKSSQSVTAGAFTSVSATGTGTMPLYGTAGTAQNAPHMVTGSVALSSGSATVTLSGSAVFASSSSYTCTANDTTAAAAVKVGQTSGTSITFTGTSTDTVQFACTGN